MPAERDLEDRHLLRCIGRGDAEALEALMRRYWDPLASLAARIGGALDAEDIVLDAFVRIWQRGGSWGSVVSVRSLLYRITRNRALNQRRSDLRVARRVEQLSPQAPAPATPADELEAADLQEAFEAALDRLPARRREVYRLVRFEGLHYREAAEVLGLSPQTTANHLTAALQDLRRALAPRIGPSRRDRQRPEHLQQAPPRSMA